MYDALLAGKSRIDAIADVDLSLKRINYWLKKHGFSGDPTYRKSQKYLKDDVWVRAAYEKLASGVYSTKQICKTINTSRGQLYSAFTRLGLSTKYIIFNRKVEKVIADLPRIAEELKTIKQAVLAAHYGINLNTFRKILHHHKIQTVYTKKGRDIWLSKVPPDEVRAVHAKLAQRESTYLAETTRLGISSAGLKNLFKRLGLPAVKIFDKKEPTREEMLLIHKRMTEGMAKDVAISGLNVNVSCINHWFRKYKLPSPTRFFSRKYLNDEAWVRAAYDKIASGQYRSGPISAAIRTCRTRLFDAFKRFGLDVPKNGIRYARVIKELVEKLPQIAEELKTEKQRVVSKRHGVTERDLRRVVKEHGIRTQHESKGKTIWLSKVSPEDVRKAFDRIVTDGSSYLTESTALGIKSTGLKKLFVRLGLTPPVLVARTKKWMSRIPEDVVVLAYKKVSSGKSTITKEAKRLRIKQPSLKHLFVRLGVMNWSLAEDAVEKSCTSTNQSAISDDAASGDWDEAAQAV